MARYCPQGGGQWAGYGLTPQLPAPYPAKAVDRPIRSLRRRSGGVQPKHRQRDFLANYQAWFEGGLPPGESANIAASFTSIGVDPAPVLRQADHPDTDATLIKASETAKSPGIFAPPA